MTDYVVLAETGIVLEGADDSVHAKGKVLVLDSENEQVRALVDNGSIAPVMTLTEDQLEDFTVTEEFLTENPSMAEIAKVGDVIKLPKAEVFAADAVEENADAAGGNADAVEENATEEVEAPEVATETEPVMYYAGQVVISHAIRTVNDREMHHVRLLDGSEQDISDEEYEVMVKNAQ